MANNRKWLILSYFSGVDGLASSHHIDDRIVELGRLGIEPIVVSSYCSPPSADYEKIRSLSLAPSGVRYEMRYATRRAISNDALLGAARVPIVLALLPGYAIEKAMLRLDSTWSWFLTASRAAVGAARKYGADVIYSSSGAPSAHLAAYLCARKTGLPWIAEYQDPIAGEHIPGPRTEKRLYAQLERLVAEHADAVLFVTRTALEEAEKRTPLAGRGHFIHPGAREDLFSGLCVGPLTRSPARGEKLVIGHFGSLGDDRNVGAILDVLSDLALHDPEAADDIRLRLVGDRDRSQTAMLAEFKYRGMLDVRGKCSRAESLRMMLECDLLLLVQNASPHSAVSIPSKLYEYLRSGLPILGLTHSNDELSAMLRGLGHLACDVRDRFAIQSALAGCHAAWKAGRWPGLVRAGDYTTARATEQLIEIANGLGHTTIRRGKLPPDA